MTLAKMLRAFACCFPIDAHEAGFDEFLHARTAELGTASHNEAVETHARIAGGNNEFAMRGGIG